MVNKTAKKITIVTCYRDPDYVRARTIRSALDSDKSNTLRIIKNKHKGLLRYPEVICKLIKSRVADRPDIYILTFRGYEILPFLLLIAGKKPVIFDEFINLVEWVVFEHKILNPNKIIAKTVTKVYKRWLRKTELILADTKSHADYSSQLMKLPRSRYIDIPVGTDENIFHPMDKSINKKFTVMYYGNMLPLHGLQYVLDAAVQLKELDIKFIIIGGKDKTKQMVDESINKGAKITYKDWVEFKELPKLMNDSDLFLGGPFGNTVQSQYVITGKTYQALALKTPVLVGRNKESSKFIDKENCLIAEQGSSEQISEAIVWAYKHRDKLQTIGVEGNNTYSIHYSAKQIKLKLITEINKLL